MAGLRIALMNHGTRGDIQPLTALGRELTERGNSVVAAVPSGYADLVRAAGIEALALPADWRAFLTDPAADRSWLHSGDRAELLAGLRGVMAAHGEEIARTLLAASADADLLVSGALTEDVATVVAEARGIPLALMHLFPVRRNGVWANPFVTSSSSTDPAANIATHLAFEQAGWAASRPGVNRLRAALGLPETDLPTFARAESLGAVEIQAYSPNVVPGLDWTAARPLVGWLQPDVETRRLLGEQGLDDDTERWLAEGPPPGFFGFGSMPVADPAATLEMIQRTAEQLDVRAVVAAGWAGLPGADVRDPDRIHLVPEADFSALFPRCAFVVHHGGAGTTGQAAQAGVPALVASVMLDQAMWGSAIERLGAGVHRPLRELDADALTGGVKHLLHPDVAETAAALGRLVRREPDPVGRTADILEAHARS
ncbi:MAG TPA: glycosyltransferase [Actinospica sp.]|nr:glycosyltransferase [Actinospica sp.]